MASMKIKAWSGKDLFKNQGSGCGDKILYFQQIFLPTLDEA